MIIKRAISTGVIIWVIIFIIVSVLMFIPSLQDKDLWQNIIFWIVIIPVILGIAKWYFKMDPPTVKKGLYLGLIGLVVGTILDLLITIPFFVGPNFGGFMPGLVYFYSDWMLWFGFLEMIILCVLAGFEFDATYTKKDLT